MKTTVFVLLFASSLVASASTISATDPQACVEESVTFALPEVGPSSPVEGVEPKADPTFYSLLAFTKTSIHEAPQHCPTPPSVPLPAAAWLFGSALLGMSVFARRQSS